jgi:hypothetical protein
VSRVVPCPRLLSWTMPIAVTMSTRWKVTVSQRDLAPLTTCVKFRRNLFPVTTCDLCYKETGPRLQPVSQRNRSPSTCCHKQTRPPLQTVWSETLSLDRQQGALPAFNRDLSIHMNIRRVVLISMALDWGITMGLGNNPALKQSLHFSDVHLSGVDYNVL